MEVFLQLNPHFLCVHFTDIFSVFLLTSEKTILLSFASFLIMHRFQLLLVIMSTFLVETATSTPSDSLNSHGYISGGMEIQPMMWHGTPLEDGREYWFNGTVQV